MARLKIKEVTIKQLWGLSCNTCAFPECTQKLIDEKNNVIGENCHIEAANETGARYNLEMSDEERRSFENLIIFCPTHHVITDDEMEYTVKKLKIMKEEHETKCKDSPIQLSDEQLKKIMEREETLQQQNIFIGTGKQITTQKGDITIQEGFQPRDVVELLQVIIGGKFPSMQASNEETLRRVKKFGETMIRIGSDKLNDDERKKFADPAIRSSVLNAAKVAVDRDEEELRENLAFLLVERIKNSDQNLRSIVYSETIETIGKLTIDELKIITLCFILRYALWQGVFSLANLDELIKNKLSFFLDFKNTPAEFQHIAYTGCGEFGIGQWNYSTIIQNQYSDLEPLTISKAQLDIHRIPEEITSELFSEIDDENFKFNITNDAQLEDYLSKVSCEEIKKNSIRTEFNVSKQRSVGIISANLKNFQMIQRLSKIIDETELRHLSLTSVGIAIGAMYYERITEEKINISIWIN